MFTTKQMGGNWESTLPHMFITAFPENLVISTSILFYLCLFFVYYLFIF